MTDFYPHEKNGKQGHLLEVAERLFAQHGFEAVSIRKLAAEARMNIAMVSYYFQSKDNLLEHLIKEKFARTRDRLAELKQASLSPWEKLLATVDIYAEKFFDDRNFHRIIVREMSLSQRPDRVKKITEHWAYSLGIVRGFIHDGQRDGTFRSIDVELTLASVFGSFSALISQGSLMCVMLQEACEADIYSEKNRVRFTAHLKDLLRSHLMKD